RKRSFPPDAPMGDQRHNLDRRHHEEVESSGNRKGRVGGSRAFRKYLGLHRQFDDRDRGEQRGILEEKYRLISKRWDGINQNLRKGHLAERRPWQEPEALGGVMLDAIDGLVGAAKYFADVGPILED